MRSTIGKVVALALGAVLLSSAAMAQNVDFDAAMQAGSQIMYGPGMRIVVTGIAGYLFFYGLAHERLWACLCGVLGAVGYWGMGVWMGKIGIALNDTPHPHATALAMAVLHQIGIGT